MLDTVSAPSPVPSEIFALVATIVVSGVALLILRYFLPLRATPAFYLVPIFFAIFLPAAIVLLVPIDLSSSARTEDAATRGIWLPDRVLLVSWRITYWLTFALTWFILPILAEYSDAGHREPYAKLMYSLRSNAQYYAIVLGASCIGLISIFVTYGFSFSSLKDVVMALAYCWGLIFVIYLMGHGLVSIPRQLFRNANLNGRLRRLQSHAPALYEKMEDSLLKLEDVEAQVAELKRRKIGSARDFDDWIEELAELAGIPDSGLAPPSDPALGAQVRAIPTVITEQYMATLARELIRARHARSRYVIEWNRLVQEAAETKAVLDSATSKKLEIGEANPESSPWSRTTILTPYTRYLLHYHVMPYVRIFLGSVLSLASVSIIWSEIFKVFGQRFSISIIRFTVVHHWVDSKPQVGFGGQVVSTLWILYMCAAAFTSITEVKVWRGRALTRRNTAYESAFWYSQQVAKLSVPLSYNFVTLLSEDIYTKTTFYQFLGKIIDFTPLGRWFDFLFPIFILLPVFATLFGMYGRVRRFLGFGLVITDDDEEEGEPGRRSYAAAGSWREGRDLIDRDLSGHSLSRRRDEARPRAAGAGQGRSAPVLSIPPARGGGASPVRSPVRGGGAAARRAGSSRDAWEEPTEDENFFQLLGHRMKNTVDTFESPRWLQEIGEGVRKPKWMGGSDGNEGGSGGGGGGRPSDFRRWFGGGNDEGRVRL
ncbi:related to integral membrane protein [Cephalotrichum gorgonifer]|uniref:Related to integral membrane protein n=1 Tax=Cephalotrichum gorgonifer TaxID=2041049 RepID=A0AAE8MWZ5_9PEZI|nr:related to integral membrane protein [Cephalotrichum gorgonifer]